MISHSQAGQDTFVHFILDGQTDGTYLEIGAGHPIEGNNTYALEKYLNWNGVSLEIEKELVENFKKERKNTIIHCDSTTFDWNTLPLNTGVIDYMSFDVDDASAKTFERFPFDKYEFKVITIEHDAYRFGAEPRNTMRKTLSTLGYQLVCLDVRIRGGMFEDWWVHPKYVDMNRAYTLSCRGIEYTVILDLISKYPFVF